MATTQAKREPTSAATDLPVIEVYSTLTKKKAPLVTVKPGHVGMYLCGPTVYKPSHIGHMVGPVIFDTVKRYLEYSGWQVTWVVNITDVDDKIIAESTARGTTMAKLAEEMTADSSMPRMAAIRSRIRGRCGRILGRWAKITQSRFTTR